ncbi:MAG: hypothetical protein IKU44_04520 [Firmicutes bacterium]|nr:hypothetical protein [Bacillota bacterium]
MARKIVELQRVDLNQGLNVTFVTPSSVSDGFALDFSAQDERTVALFKGTGTVTIKQGNGIQGVVDCDTITINGLTVFRLDSGAYKNVTGADKGYVVAIPSANTVEAAVIRLP